YALYANDDAGVPSAHAFVGGDTGAGGAATLPLDTWTHVAATYDGVTLCLYVNGVRVSSRALPGAIATSADPLVLGGNAVWGEWFAGLIDEVRIYRRALSATEIQADMSRPVATPPPPSPVGGGPSSGPVAAYSLDGGSGTTVADDSGNGNTGTVDGA